MLKNLLNITNNIELAYKEEELSKTRAMQLWDNNLLEKDEPGTIATLQKIHHHLFQDIYDFAGKIRTVNISKGNFRFAPVMFLETQLPIIEQMPDSTSEEIVAKYAEINVAHPFREGNGRAGRLWLDHLMGERLGQQIKWENISKDDYMEAMIRSTVNITELLHLFKENLTSNISERSFYAHNINTSYFYEGYNSYNANNL